MCLSSDEEMLGPLLPLDEREKGRMRDEEILTRAKDVLARYSRWEEVFVESEGERQIEHQVDLMDDMESVIEDLCTRIAALRKALDEAVDYLETMEAEPLASSLRRALDSGEGE